MSATNKTANYELPIFIDTDKPSWLGDWNGAMTKIDNSVKAVSGVADGATTAANNAIAQAETATTTANNALTAAGEAKESATGATAIANNAYTLAGDAQTDAHEALEKSNTVSNKLTVTMESARPVTGSLYTSYIYKSQYLSKIVYQCVSNTLSSMTKDDVQIEDNKWSKVPFSTASGNLFGLDVCPSGSVENMVTLGFNIAKYQTTEAYSDYLQVIIYYDGTNTNFGIWISTALFNTITAFKCLGTSVYLSLIHI